jgi:uncharacterized membrane protein
MAASLANAGVWPNFSGKFQLTPNIRLCHYLAISSLIGLIALCIAWETFLAPLRPGGSWLMLKAVPLLLPLFGILRGRRYTYQWASMFVLFYFTEGAVRAWSDRGLSATLALLEVLLAVVFFFAAIYFARLTAPAKAITGANAADG